MQTTYKFLAVDQPGSCDIRYYPESDAAKFLVGERAYFDESDMHTMRELSEILANKVKVEVEYVSLTGER